MRIQVEESTITKRLYLVFCGKTLHSLSKGPIFYSGSTAAAIAIVFDIWKYTIYGLSCITLMELTNISKLVASETSQELKTIYDYITQDAYMYPENVGRDILFTPHCLCLSK